MPQTTLLNTTVAATTTPVVSPWFPLQGKNAALGLHLVADGTLDGAWTIQASCSPAVPPALPVDPADVTAGFSPTVAAVAHGTVLTQSQFLNCSALTAGYARATFTPSAGSGGVRVHVNS